MRSPQITLVGQSVSWLLCARLLSLALAFYFLASALPVAAADDQPPNAKRALFMPMINGGNATAATGAAIVAGNSHTCALRDGSVYCWGLNISGQLGNGTTLESHTPVAVSGLSGGVTALTAGYDYSCAVVGGSVQCWGSNTYGELGDGTNSPRATPAAVTGLTSGMKAVAAGYFHACAVNKSGGVQCWGNNQSSRLGDGTTADSLVPVAVSGLSSGVTALVAGWGHTCALTTSGGVKCWGSNASGQLGDGTILTRAIPVAVSGLSSGVIALSAGDSHTCALLNNGSVKCWGFNGSGQLGDDSDANSPTPVTVSGLNEGVIAIAASYGHNCAIVSNGTLSRAVKCWGFNETGQLGDLTITYRTAPVEVGGSTGAIAVGAGWGHSCMLTDSGAECWGKNFNGQLGDNTTEFSPGPVDVLWP